MRELMKYLQNLGFDKVEVEFDDGAGSMIIRVEQEVATMKVRAQAAIPTNALDDMSDNTYNMLLDDVFGHLQTRVREEIEKL